MSESKQLPMPPQWHEPEVPQHIEGYIPLGQEAIQLEEERVYHSLAADWHDRAADFKQNMNLHDSEVEDDPHRSSLVIGRKVLAKVTDGRFGTGDKNHMAIEERVAADSAFEASLDKELFRDGMLKQTRAHLREFEAFNRDTIVDGKTVPNPKREALNNYFRGQAPVSIQNSYNSWMKDRMYEDQILDVVQYEDKEYEVPEEKITSEYDYANWLAQEPDLSMNAEGEFPSDPLINVLQWHNNRTEQLNRDPAVQERIAEQKQLLKDSILADIASGELIEDAAIATTRIDETRVIIGDIFDTVLKDRLGYHFYGSKTVVVEEGYNDETFRHEMYHATLGMFKDQIMNEAMTEHLTLAGESGDYATINPDRREDVGTYIEFRRVLSGRMTAGKNPNLFNLALASFIEGNENGPATVAYRAAERESFSGINMDKFTSHEITHAMNKLRAKNPDMTERMLTENAARYAYKSIVMMGALSRGVPVDKLKLSWANGRTDPSGIFDHIERVEEYRKANNLKALARR